MGLSIQQKQAVLKAAKSTIDVNPFSSLPVPATDQECNNKLIELNKVFGIPGGGVAPPHFPGPYAIPGQSEAVFSDP
jgi:hypothetical protein